LAGDSQLGGDPFGIPALCGAGNDAGVFDPAGWEGVRTGKALEIVTLLLGQPDLGSAERKI
jgi:hypothetical protein